MAEKIQIVINAKDNASGPIGKVNRSLTGLQSAAGVVGKAIAGGLAIGGAAFAAFGAASLNISIDVEDAFAGVIKTTDGLIDVSGDLTDAGRSLRRAFRDLSVNIPVDVTELMGIGELGGQLGVAKDDLIDFSEVMAQLGVTTNLTSEEASSALAQLSNVMGTSAEYGPDAWSRLGSTIVELGNNLATTEADIVSFASYIGGAGEIAGMTEADVLSIGAAMSSVGVQAEAGGTAIQKVFLGINEAVTTGSESLDVFAETAGLSADEFAKLWDDDASAAFEAFVEGLGAAGDDAISVLTELELADQRLVRAFLSLANAGDLLSDSLEIGNEAWEQNIALSKEAEIRFGTTRSKLKILKNTFKDLSLSIGDELLPVFTPFLDNLKMFVDRHGPKVVEWTKNLVGGFTNLTDYFSIVAREGNVLNDFLANVPISIRPVVEGAGEIVNAFRDIKIAFDTDGWPAVGDLFGEWVDSGVAIIGSKAEELRSAISNIDMGEKAGELWGQLASWWDTGGAQWAVDAASAVGQWIDKIAWDIGAGAKTLWDGAVTWWDTGGAQWAVDAAGKVKQFIDKATWDVSVAAGNLWQGFVDWWDGPNGAIMINAMWENFKATIEAEWSPKFYDIGFWVASKLGGTIENETGKIDWSATVAGIVGGIAFAMGEATTMWDLTAGMFWEGLKDAIVAKAPDAFKPFMDEIFTIAVDPSPGKKIDAALSVGETFSIGVFQGAEAAMDYESPGFVQRIEDTLITPFKDSFAAFESDKASEQSLQRKLEKMMDVDAKDTIFDPSKLIKDAGAPVGQEMMAGVVAGITAGSRAVNEAAISAALQALAAAKAALGIESPSKAFMEIGALSVEGMAIGITAATPSAISAAQNMSAAVMGAANVASLTPATVSPMIATSGYGQGGRMAGEIFAKEYVGAVRENLVGMRGEIVDIMTPAIEQERARRGRGMEALP